MQATKGTESIKSFHNCYFSYDKPARFPTIEGLKDDEILDGLIYWCQRMRLSKEFKIKYMSFYEEAKKRFLK
jgi:hypothetical protein